MCAKVGKRGLDPGKPGALTLVPEDADKPPARIAQGRHEQEYPYRLAPDQHACLAKVDSRSARPARSRSESSHGGWLRVPGGSVGTRAGPCAGSSRCPIPCSAADAPRHSCPGAAENAPAARPHDRPARCRAAAAGTRPAHLQRDTAAPCCAQSPAPSPSASLPSPIAPTARSS